MATKYSKPPIIERALAVHATVDEEKFQTQLDSWRESVARDFPHSETVTEWILAVAEKDGMPVLDPTKQTMTLRQTFWQLAGRKKKEGIQLWPDRVSFNLIGEPGHPRDYEELDALREKWLLRWASHFEVSECGGVTMEYVNLLSAETLPRFVTGNTIRIGEVLRMFQAVPDKLHSLHPPFDFQFNIDGETTPPSRFRAVCLSLNLEAPAGTPPQIQLRFTATTHLSDNRKVPLTKVGNEARLMHDLIIQQFETYFTPEAKSSFEPICP